MKHYLTNQKSMAQGARLQNGKVLDTHYGQIEYSILDFK